MDPNRYTEKSREAIVAAQQIADRAGHPEVVPEHLLLALLRQPEGIVPALAGKLKATPDALANDVQTLVDKLPNVRGGAQPGVSSRLRAIFTAAEQEAER